MSAGHTRQNAGRCTCLYLFPRNCTNTIVSVCATQFISITYSVARNITVKRAAGQKNPYLKIVLCPVPRHPSVQVSSPSVDHPPKAAGESIPHTLGQAEGLTLPCATGQSPKNQNPKPKET